MNCVLFKSPIQNDFLDLAFNDNNIGVVVGIDEKEADECDREFMTVCRFQYDMEKGVVEILDDLRLYAMLDDWDGKYKTTILSRNSMKLPDYVGDDLDEKSISSCGNYLVYYSDQTKRIGVSKCENGEIYRIFICPIEISEDTDIYFNSKTGIMSIFYKGCIKKFYIKQSDERIQELNNPTVLDTNKLWKTIFSCECKDVQSSTKFKYDIALSFAGEDRDYVDNIAKTLKQRGIKVFYDKFETPNLWGKDLYQYLNSIYKDNAKYCIIFISNYYKKKAWTRHELKSAQNRAFLENREYILPIYIDDVKLEGLNDTIGYIKTSEYTEAEIIDIIMKKISTEI